MEITGMKITAELDINSKLGKEITKEFAKVIKKIETEQKPKKIEHKQRPKKVKNVHVSINSRDIEYMGDDTLYGKCPCCFLTINNLWNKCYCGDCGQKVEWCLEE